MSAGKVLVLGDDTRGFLAVVRSLGRQGVVVHAAPANFRSPALRSRYIAAIHDLPPWIGDGSEWLAATTALLQTEHFDLVIPCNETALLPLQRHRAALSQLAALAIPDDRAIAVLFDKHTTRELARQVGVPIAPGRLLRAEDEAQAILEEFGRPVVLKPRRSYALDKLVARGAVHVAAEPDGLARLLRASDPDETIVERFFAGQGVGVSLLASRGWILQAFEHHRVREIAGASFYRVSAPLAGDLVHACAAIVSAIEYTGIAMFEFKRGADGACILLEVNARPWGSLPLPVALGIDFPYRWYRLLIAGEETAANEYRIGVYGRNLFPDLQNTLIEIDARRLGRLASVGLVARRVAEMARVVTGREVHDVLVRDDPRPGLAEFVDFGCQAYRRGVGRLPGRLEREAQRQRRWTLYKITTSMRNASGPLGISFVCQGNICRSPFAAALLRARLDDCRITIDSAGTLPQRGRAPPSLGVAAAAARGIDIAAHRSSWFDRKRAKVASLVIVFDEITHAGVLNRYPELQPRLFRLGDLTATGEIADPVNGGPAEFARVFDQIAAAIGELAPLLRRTAPTAG